MTLLMTELEVRLPDRRGASSFSTSKKPMAEVSCIMDNDRTREIVVPVRVGRLLMTDAIALPLPEEEAFDAIHALEGKICFAQLTEMLSRRGNDYLITDIVRSKSMRPYPRQSMSGSLMTVGLRPISSPNAFGAVGDGGKSKSN